MTASRSKVSYRRMTREDIPHVLKMEAECFPSIPSDRYWKPEMLEAHVDKFPEGQTVAEVEGVIIGSSTAFRVSLLKALTPHRWRDIAGGGYLGTHEPGGMALYGTEIMVHPQARRRGVARGLYARRKQLIRDLNMRAFVAGGRIPDYHKVAPIMSAQDYVQRVVDGRLVDRTLTPQLRSGITVAGVMPRYLRDQHSLDWATLLVWWNLHYKAD